ncbi:hypothetical protein, partial [Chitinophaga agrisoli]|uniref:hypothetical protein n=1 Tax=Chitinophaga agrisoli TaxID=2607653 RepID=UPI001661EE57
RSRIEVEIAAKELEKEDADIEQERAKLKAREKDQDLKKLKLQLEAYQRAEIDQEPCDGKSEIAREEDEVSISSTECMKAWIPRPTPAAILTSAPAPLSAPVYHTKEIPTLT